MTDKGNEAEGLRDMAAERQQHEQDSGKTSAGGAGSTGTSGNTESGVDTTDAEDGGPRSGITES